MDSAGTSRSSIRAGKSEDKTQRVTVRTIFRQDASFIMNDTNGMSGRPEQVASGHIPCLLIGL